MLTELRPAPVDMADEDDDENHIACSRVNRTWCGLDAENIEPLMPPLPPLETFCRICLAAAELLDPHDPCPVCNTLECLAS